MKIEVGKFYKTRDGSKVRIYAIGSNTEMAIHGAYYLNIPTPGWYINHWYTTGRVGYTYEMDCPLDIISEWNDPQILITRIDSENGIITSCDHDEHWKIENNLPIEVNSLDDHNAHIAWHHALLINKDSGLDFKRLDALYRHIGEHQEALRNLNFVEGTKTALDEAAHKLLEIVADYGKPKFIPIVETQEEINLHIKNLKDKIKKDQEEFEGQTYILNGQLAQICNCGGTINVHKKTCPENNQYEPIPYPYELEELEPGESHPLGMYEYHTKSKAKCECGAEAVGSSGHSPWCAKHEVS